MRRAGVLRAGLALACLLPTAACGEGMLFDDGASCIEDYPYYDSLDGLVEQAELVVIAVAGEKQERMLTFDALGEREYEVWPLQVERMLRGELPDRPLEFVQSSCVDDPEPEEGEPALMFLSVSPDLPAFPLSNYQALYPLEDGEPTPLEDNPLSFDLATLEAAIASAPPPADR